MTSSNTTSLTLRVRNVRGVREIEAPLGGVTLVAGQNGAGKTSIAQAIAAAVTGQPPIAGLKKSEFHLLLRAGTAAGSAEVATTRGRAVFALPEGRVTTEGVPPQASPFAAGVLSILDMAPKQAAQALAEYIDAEPTEDDLRAALPELDEATFVRLWADVQATGWDGAHANAREDGARLKGRWEATTGERYGVKKAAQWRPGGWADELADATPEALAQAEADALEAYSRAIQAAAVNDNERQRLAEAAAQVEPLTKALAEADAAWCAAEDADTTAYHAAMRYKALAQAEAQAVQTCPHCGEALVVRAGRVVAADAAPAVDAASQGEAIAAREAFQAAHAALTAASEARAALGARLETAQHAAQRLADLPAFDADAVGAEQAQAALEAARARSRAHDQARRAGEAHAAILVTAAIVQALAPDGVRADTLARALGEFNATLAALCATARWPVVRLETDMAVSYGDRPYLLLSESEQYRARAIVQTAQALADGSTLLIYDRADLLDRTGRNGLLRLARAAAIPAVVCMTADTAADVPDLAAKGLGRTLWISGGEIVAA